MDNFVAIIAGIAGILPVQQFVDSAALLPMHQLVFFAILAVAIGLLVTEKMRTDMIALLIILALALTGILSPEEALAGFQSEPAIVIAAVFVLGAGLRYTGLSESLGRWTGRYAGGGMTRMLVVLMPASALLSTFTHHVAITAIMLPTTLSLAKQRGVAASKLLIPMAIGSSLGTTIATITPSFLVAGALLRQAGRPGLDLFSIAPIGLVLSLAGIVYMVLVGRHLLPTRQGTGDSGTRFRLDGYFTELRILSGSPLVGKTIKQVHADRAYRFTIAGWVRDGQSLRAPLGDRALQANDVLLIHTTPGGLVALREERGVALEPVAQYEPSHGGNASANHGQDPAERLTQAIIAPRSSLVGRTLAEVDFRRHFGALVVALWRKGGFVPEQLSQVRLSEGDTLVLQGDDEALARVGEDPDFLMLVPFHGEARRPRKALLAGAILGGTILAASLHVMTLGMAMLAGAAVMLLTRCLTARQAYKAIDAPMYLFVAGAIPLGAAMKQSGAADMVASLLQGALGGWNEWFILLALFAVVGIVVQFMGSDSATTALFGPLAIALALALG
ncbi:MAG TPA: SLC13 family permease, partial [Chloroflexota bacterium]|nr:SLC13 family permease [Chloroflexota bacterium]